jgi:hypothetical protein
LFRGVVAGGVEVLCAAKAPFASRKSIPRRGVVAGHVGKLPV